MKEKKNKLIIFQQQKISFTMITFQVLDEIDEFFPHQCPNI
mgnify:CR=1 FL=1